MTTEAVAARAQTYQGLEEARHDLLAAIEGLPPEKMTVPFLDQWSVKDVLAHVSSWDEVITLDLQRIARGHMPFLAAFREQDINDWNAFLMKGRRLFPLPQVRAELEANRRAAREALDAMPDAVFGEGQLVRTFCDITAGHDREHTGHIRQWRQREGL